MCHVTSVETNGRNARDTTLRRALTADVLHALAREVRLALILLALSKNAGCGEKCTSLQGADIPDFFSHPTGPHLAAFILP